MPETSSENSPEKTKGGISKIFTNLKDYIKNMLQLWLSSAVKLMKAALHHTMQIAKKAANFVYKTVKATVIYALTVTKDAAIWLAQCTFATLKSLPMLALAASTIALGLAVGAVGLLTLPLAVIPGCSFISSGCFGISTKLMTNGMNQGKKTTTELLNSYGKHTAQLEQKTIKSTTKLIEKFGKNSANLAGEAVKEAAAFAGVGLDVGVNAATRTLNETKKTFVPKPVRALAQRLWQRAIAKLSSMFGGVEKPQANSGIELTNMPKLGGLAAGLINNTGGIAAHLNPQSSTPSTPKPKPNLDTQSPTEVAEEKLRNEGTLTANQSPAEVEEKNLQDMKPFKASPADNIMQIKAAPTLKKMKTLLTAAKEGQPELADASNHTKTTTPTPTPTPSYTLPPEEKLQESNPVVAAAAKTISLPFGGFGNVAANDMSNLTSPRESPSTSPTNSPSATTPFSTRPTPYSKSG